MWKIKRTNISTPVQLGFLVKQFPESKGTVKRDQLTWSGRIRPTPLSDCYTVRVVYRVGKSPQVLVDAPELQMRDGKLPPHRYGGNRLCLYLPGAFEWDGSMQIAETIVPWASEWLYFYELWLVTGEWLGGGEHPHPKDKGKADDCERGVA